MNSIVFQIPTTDPGYNPANGTFTISLQKRIATDHQPGVRRRHDRSKLSSDSRRMVVIDGQGVKAPADGLDLEGNADGSTIDGLEIVNFSGGSGGNWWQRNHHRDGE